MITATCFLRIAQRRLGVINHPNILSAMSFKQWIQPIAIFFLVSTLCIAQDDIEGEWLGSLKSPGGSLEFGLKFVKEDEVYRSYLINGPELIKLPATTRSDREILLEILHYDSRLELNLHQDGKAMSGVWVKTRGADKVSRMDVLIEQKNNEEGESVQAFLGKWLVDFSSSDDPAIAMIRPVKDKPDRCSATFRTTTGDYRFLSGRVVDGELKLSVFDGAHAFLFHAELDEDGKLRGDFWSSLNWHETWTAVKKEDAEMPDAFSETTWRDQELGDIKFPNLDGRPISLNDPAFVGKPRLIHVFGSWCPNCHDAGIYLGELHEKYGDDLSILGLAFELTGNFERDAKQVRLFQAHHKTDYPVLIAGLADKSLASQAIPFLDRVRSYPTTVFIDAQGKVRGVHTGFNGPATGTAHDELKDEFESRIDAMIKDWKSN